MDIKIGIHAPGGTVTVNLPPAPLPEEEENKPVTVTLTVDGSKMAEVINKVAKKTPSSQSDQ